MRERGERAGASLQGEMALRAWADAPTAAFTQPSTPDHLTPPLPGPALAHERRHVRRRARAFRPLQIDEQIYKKLKISGDLWEPPGTFEGPQKPPKTAENLSKTIENLRRKIDEHFFSQRRPPEVWRPFLGPVFHPGSFFDGPGAGRRPRGAENVEKPPGAFFCVAWI